MKDLDITDPENLIEALQSLFSHPNIAYDDWYTAVADFKDHIIALATELQKLVAQEQKESIEFRKAFDVFYLICQFSINRDLAKDQVEEMLIQTYPYRTYLPKSF